MSQLATYPNNLDPNPNELRLRRWLTLAVGLIAISVFFFELGDSKTFSSHESYTVVPVREMLDSGDWIVPRHGGIPRLEKPPLNYWLTAAVARMFGEINEWTTRFPAAVSAVLLVALVGFWGTRWFGRQVGLAAALAQSLSVHAFVFGRKAEVDMLLCLFVVSALFLVAHQPTGQSYRQGFWRWFTIYSLIGLAWLCKFYYGAVMVMVPAVAYLVVQRRFADLKHLLNPLGWEVVAICALVWPNLVFSRIPEAAELWMSETVGRATGAANFDRQPIWYYLPQLVSLGFPAVLFATYRVRQSWNAAWKAGNSKERFLWVWLLCQLAIVSASPNKHPNYILPALPVLSLSAGIVIVRVIQFGREGKIRLPGWVMVPSTIAVVGASAVSYLLASNRWPHLTEPLICICSLLAIGCVVISLLLGTRRPLTAGCVMVAMYMMCYFLLVGWIVPGRDHRLPAARFARHVRSLYPEQEICVFGLRKAPVVFYVAEPVLRSETPVVFSKQLVQERHLLVMTSERHLSKLQKFADYQIVRRIPDEQTDDSRPDSKLLLLRVSGNAETYRLANSAKSSLH